MSKGKKDSTPQLGLFGQGQDPTEPGSFYCEDEIIAEMNLAIKRSRLSRAEIAEHVAELTGEKFTRVMLDAITAQSKKLHRTPAGFLPAFCTVTKYDGPIRVLARKIGQDISDPQTLLLAGIGEAHLGEEESRTRKLELIRRLKR